MRGSTWWRGCSALFATVASVATCAHAHQLAHHPPRAGRPARLAHRAPSAPTMRVARAPETEADDDELADGEVEDAKWVFDGGMDVAAFLEGLAQLGGDLDTLANGEARGGGARRRERSPRGAFAEPTVVAPSRELETAPLAPPPRPGADASLDVELSRARAQHRLIARLSEPLVVTPPQDLAATVSADGVARAAGVLRAETAAALRAHILELVGQSEAEVAAGLAAERERFSEVLSGRSGAAAARTRWDVRLPLTPPVVAAVDELMGGEGPLAYAFSRLAGGGRAELWELAAIVSMPGSAPQLVHADTLFSERPVAFTAFVALQPVTRELGPTVFVPGSHTRSAHVAMSRPDPEGRDSGAGGAFLAAASARLGCMDAGDATLYDSRLLHAGGANRGDVPRVLVYLTFATSRADAAEHGNEEAHSIRPALAARRISLAKLRRGAGLLADA